MIQSNLFHLIPLRRAPDRVRLLGVTLTTLTAEILALKLVVAAVIETLPERQRAAADNALKSMRHPAGLENASFAHFSTGEEATHTMLKSQTEILGMVSKLAAASGVTPPTTPP